MSEEVTLAGLAIGLLVVVAYLCTAWKKQKPPELQDGIGVFICAVSAVGALRLIGFAALGFNKLVKAAPDAAGIWSASPSDVVFVAAGGLALAWVSVDAIWKNFAKLMK